MSLVFVGVMKEGAVIVADGRALSDSEEKISDNFRKVFHIKDHVYVGISGRGITKEEIDMLIEYFKLDIIFKRPYTIKDLVNAFAHIIDEVFKNKPKYFWLALCVAGYDKDLDGKPKIPRIALYKGRNDKQIHYATSKDENFIMAIGSADYNKYKIDTMPDVDNLDDLTNYFISKIREVELQEKTVGGDILSVIIEKDGSKETKPHA